jgi:uncharacterized protein
MPEYLYRLTLVRLEMLIEATPEEEAIAGEHFEWVKENARKGLILLAGRTLNIDDSTFGIVIFRAASDEAAQAFKDNDPAVTKGIMRAEVFPYRVALLADMTLDDWRAEVQ